MSTQTCVEVKYAPGDVIAVANGHPNSRVFLVKSGEVTLVSADVHISGESLWGCESVGGRGCGEMGVGLLVWAWVSADVHIPGESLWGCGSV